MQKVTVRTTRERSGVKEKEDLILPPEGGWGKTSQSALKDKKKLFEMEQDQCGWRGVVLESMPE